MQNDHITPKMSQKVFTLGLDTETVSLYLLCCGLADIGNTLSDKSLTGIWNGTAESLQVGLDQLIAHGILRQVISDGDQQAVYHLVDEDHWHRS